jgi:trk system potassium uptake protein
MLRGRIESIINFIIRFFDILLLTILIFDFGFVTHEVYERPKLIGLAVIPLIIYVFNIYKYFFFKDSSKRKLAFVTSTLLAIILVVSIFVGIINKQLGVFDALYFIRPILEGGLILYFLLRLMMLVRYIYNVYFNPAMIFVVSFLTIILAGAFLLMLPSATSQGITFTNALFTATSAVCVTGLTVLDTAQDFTLIGQSIILGLIQIGGIGILTFTSFFAFFFRGGSSFREGLNVRDFVGQDNMKDVLKTARDIVGFTFILELIGALFIYYSIAENTTIENKYFFSLFHAVSAFCNAGFSTFSESLANSSVLFNYSLQWVIMILVVLGGLGHNITFNFTNYVKQKFIRLSGGVFVQKHIRIITLNTRIVIYTTLFLLVGGCIFILFSESNNTLLLHESVLGKFTTAMFNSVTTRTAGFNTVDFSQLTLPTIMLVLFLMWIGGSPASTAGGIKTSTFALASLNILSIIQGKSRIEISGRRISSDSTGRAFAIICISLIIIGFSIMTVLIFEPEGTDLLTVVFECFSAYSTVGLSLGITPHLTENSKYVLIFVMFIGRIGLLTLLMGIFRQIRHQRFYEYPKENILIN